jgi:CheY-like chemotaxis protein
MEGSGTAKSVGRTTKVPAALGVRDVLVVDDDATIREQLTELLEMEGLSVVTAGDGQEALEQLDHFKIRLIILDLMLPRLNGWDLSAVLRANADLAPIPVLTITAANNPRRAPEGPLFLKPLNTESLVHAIHRWLDPRKKS